MTTAPVVAQVSRSPRQVTLHRMLAACRIIEFDAEDAQPVGALLARSNTSDVVDAHLVCVAERYDALVLTSDGDDIAQLADHVEASVRHRRL